MSIKAIVKINYLCKDLSPCDKASFVKTSHVESQITKAYSSVLDVLVTESIRVLLLAFTITGIGMD